MPDEQITNYDLLFNTIDELKAEIEKLKAENETIRRENQEILACNRSLLQRRGQTQDNTDLQNKFTAYLNNE